MRLLVALSLAIAALVSPASAAQGQQPPVAQPARPGVPSQPLDSLQRVPPRPFDFAAPDSTMRELMSRPGYRKVQYQGDRVRFDALTRLLTLNGLPAAVKRDATMLIGDSIVYNDSLKFVSVISDTAIIRDPTQQGADDFIARGRLDYDLNARQGTFGEFSTAVTSGQKLFIRAKRGSFFGDTLVAGRHTVYAKDGSFTYCDHAEPHFHFTARDMKYVSENIMVARSGLLYIGEVPVFWLPFFVQDTRQGRRSGLLTPSFGIAELLRNSPSYRRSISNIGYFFAISDYMNAEASFDWRSGARGSDFDPGFLRGNVQYRYRWLNRFITGETAVSYMAQRNGTTNTAVTWNHNQDFSRQTRLTSRINFVQNTLVQRATTVNPVQANATIRSDLTYQTKIGPASINTGGSRVQYPGRSQVDLSFPSFNVSTGTLGNEVFSWTPALRFNIQSSQKIDQGLQFPFVYSQNSLGRLDSTRVRAGRRNLDFAFDTPIKIGDFQWNNAFAIREAFNDYPEQREVVNVSDTSQRTIRVFAKTFATNIDWTTSFNLPRFFQGSWNVTPSVNIEKIDGRSGLLVRTERSGGAYVSQGVRLVYQVSASPTVYGFYPGIGPISRFRHTISPTMSFGFSPQATVSDQFLAAVGDVRSGYLGALKRSVISFGLSTNIEGKLRERTPEEGGATPPAPTTLADSVNADSLQASAGERPLPGATGRNAGNPTVGSPLGPAEGGRKIKLVSLNFSSLAYDFVRADSTGRGIATPNFSISANTDLLPGLDFRAGYDLFQGNYLSDTAQFKPFLTDVALSFSLDGKSGIFGLFSRLLGRRSVIDAASADTRRLQTQNEANVALQSRQQNAAGGTMRGTQVQLPSGGGWQLNLQYNIARQRPPFGGTQIVNDPAAQCEGQRVFGIAAFDRCIQTATSSPPTGQNFEGTTRGGPVYISPPVQNVTSAVNFNITQNWAAQWSTQYDVTRARFASQQIGLQRSLHDWNAVFSFTQAPNGNFAFNFFIALKAQPELKFNYDRQTYRSSSF
ncbi:MAG TPA: putative LPS assembly protein LptD [Gemmatimonas sp.]|nr:putative LPS assembly protein LptD [Gemmatimonas sp.]